ncbi:MAG TPA: signal peptidase I [Candidatus Binataceae bacterium]|nr:signal peptidase I [Candidatus Binataceae bacterium]
MAQPVRQIPKQTTPAPASPAGTQKSAAREYTEAFLVALVLAIILRTFFIQAYKIPSGSMEPTLLVGDHIIVNKLDYGFRLPDSFFGFTPLAGEIPYGRYLFRLEPIHRGDVDVFVFPEDQSKDFIKRVIGIPGDTVEVKAGVVYLNGQRAPDPHAHFEKSAAERQESSQADYMNPVTLGPDQYFMMGDNRDHSYDSRFWGPVTRDAIEGRAMFIYWSCADDTSALSCFYDVRWARLLSAVR